MPKIKITKIGSDSCEPCREMKKELKKLRKAHPDWKIKTVDIDKHPKQDPGGDIPLTKICVDKKCEKITGAMTKEDIESVVGEM